MVYFANAVENIGVDNLRQRLAVVSDTSKVSLVFAHPHRWAFFIQNLSTTKSMPLKLQSEGNS